MPFAADGPRTEPPVSLPKASGANHAASAAPEPPDEPAGPRVRSCGFRVCPPSELKPFDLPLSANSLVFAFAKMMAPAARNFAVMNASAGGTDPARNTHPAVVGRSFVL